MLKLTDYGVIDQLNDKYSNESYITSAKRVLCASGRQES